jgi:PIN domain nuclease of toxin-antitoxin system
MFLWFLSGESVIPEETREAIGSSENSVLVSAASVWEIAIKSSIGRLKIARADVMKLPRLIDASGFEELPVLARHAAAVSALPLHHRDPFDRLLIAQARTEGLALVTIDPAIRRYDVETL